MAVHHVNTHQQIRLRIMSTYKWSQIVTITTIGPSQAGIASDCEILPISVNSMCIIIKRVNYNCISKLQWLANVPMNDMGLWSILVISGDCSSCDWFLELQCFLDQFENCNWSYFISWLIIKVFTPHLVLGNYLDYKQLIQEITLVYI
jgi:hypothetical protein